jgi:hypothetical protein
LPFGKGTRSGDTRTAHPTFNDVLGLEKTSNSWGFLYIDLFCVALVCGSTLWVRA